MISPNDNLGLLEKYFYFRSSVPVHRPTLFGLLLRLVAHGLKGDKVGFALLFCWILMDKRYSLCEKNGWAKCKRIDGSENSLLLTFNNPEY
jgi:hypothetical protein